MYKATCKNLRLPAAGILTALALLFALAVTKEAHAYVYPSGCQASVYYFSIAPSTPGPVHAGDTINYIVGLANPITDPSTGLLNCQISNVTINLTLPNGTVLPVVSNVFLTPGDPAITCPSPDPRCLTAVPYSYVVQTNDLHAIDPLQCPVVPGSMLRLSAATHAQGIIHSGALDGGLNGDRCAYTAVQSPHISITEECVTNCAPHSSPYGQPISFTGVVTNDGDTPVCGITVSASPSATITFDATTTMGFPFPTPVAVCPSGGLTNGDSIRYHGTYQPTANLCGPLGDVVTALGTDSIGLVVSNTANASCLVCTSPGISVTNQCPTNALPGELLTFTGSVCNTGNVPLTNVTVFSDRTLITGTNLVASFAMLTNGACQSFSGSELIPTNVCDTNISYTLTAMGTNICTGVIVSNQFLTTYRVICPPTVTIFALRLQGTNIVFSFPTEPNFTYTVIATDWLFPSNWQTFANIVGDGNVATITDPVTNGHRFYRVQVH